MNQQARFKFIADALNATGGFRPKVTYTGSGTTLQPQVPSETYLVRYPRESASKFARRNEVAFYESDLARHCSRFVSYLSSKPVQRSINSELLKIISDDVDGKGNDIDVFWQDFEIEAKARGSMLLLVDMPSSMPQDGESQLSERAAPYWTSIVPERVSDYLLGDDGKFIFVEFSGSYIKADGEPVSVTWHFDRTMWAVFENDDRGERKVIDDDIHGLSECPVLIFTERGEFPCIGSFASIAYLSRRLFNLNSELDEILRGQTFSLLTMQVRDDISEEEKLNIAKTTGETVGTSNMMMHTGSTPAFIAPPDGPARVYLDRIDKMEQRIDSAGLSPSGSNAQESGYALQMRFAAINAELSRFAGRMEDLERRAWSLSAEWLGLAEQADIAWPRDFNIADSEQELLILQQMQASAMPGSTIRQQQRRVVVTQFNGADDDAISEMVNDINNQESML